MNKCLYLTVTLLSMPIGSQGEELGHWAWMDNGLPCYHYTASLPYEAVDANGNDSQLPEDPYFLLGNYRMTAFAHVSGTIELMTAERVWARINASDQRPNYGCNAAEIEIDGKITALAGVGSAAADNRICQRRFGIGFASYEYKLSSGIECERTLSVKPSERINEGTPTLYFNITLHNSSKRSKKIVYSETFPVNFVPMGLQMMPKDERPVGYQNRRRAATDPRSGWIDITAHPNEFIIWPTPRESSLYETMPPSIAMTSTEEVTAQDNQLCTRAAFVLNPGQRKTLAYAVSMGQKAEAPIEAEATRLGLFGQQWKQILPCFDQEPDEAIRREMIWNAYVMEASAKYSSYFDETFIPQGSVYSYHYGDNIANRDHLQALLPACYTNPVLARSAIRYVLAQTHPDGEITRGNQGFGYAPPMIYKESDQQLYVFLAMAEYLRITHDWSLLDSEITMYPREAGLKTTVMNVLERQFVYLRDEIGRGPNGLIRLQNSDWSDSFLHKYSPNIFHWSAESHLNSAMALAVLPAFIKVLEGKASADFIKTLTKYYQEVKEAFLSDLGNRPYSARAYLNNQYRFGLDLACIEPHSYLLQSDALSVERKKDIYNHIKPLLEGGETIGIRTRERSMWGDVTQAEDGGIWFSLEYPLALGVATFDRNEAIRLLQKFSFCNYSKHFPQYWLGQWTAADEVNSTFYREGLYTYWIPIDNYRHGFVGYCSHPHTWPLYCYYRLHEGARQAYR